MSYISPALKLCSIEHWIKEYIKIEFNFHLPMEHLRLFLNYTLFSDEELNTFHKRIGKNIKKIRAKKEFSQMELANAIGHDSVGHIAKAELHSFNKKFNLDHFIK